MERERLGRSIDMAADLKGHRGRCALHGIGYPEGLDTLTSGARTSTSESELTDVGCCVDDGGKDERDEEGHG